MNKEAKVGLGMFLNPFNTFVHGKENNVPGYDGGPWALSKDKLVNNALWTAAGNALTYGPILGIISTILANKHWSNKIKARSPEITKGQINALRPIISSNPDVRFKKNIEKRPGEELDSIDKTLNTLEKEAKAKAEPAKAFFREGMLSALPMLAGPLAFWLASNAANSYIKDQHKKELMEERNNIQSMQDAVDADILAARKLINIDKTASIEKKADIEEYVNYAGDTVKDLFSAAKKTMIDAPVALATAILLGGTAIGGHMLHKMDDNRKKLDIMSKKMLGEDRLAETPELSFEYLPGVKPVDKGNLLQSIEGIPASDKGRDQFF